MKSFFITFLHFRSEKADYWAKKPYLCNMERKTVLLDISDIGNPTSGFGQIAKNYAEWYSKMEDDSLKFHFLLPPGYEKDFGPLVDTTCMRRKYHKYFSKGLPTVNLWHSIPSSN